MAGTAHAIYLHGFGSSPDSVKAGALRARLGAGLASYTVPDLEPDPFRALTMDSRRARARAAVDALPDDGAPLLLVGSSLGAYQALRLAGAGLGRPAALLLVAPAFGFAERWVREHGPEAAAAWERDGERPFYRFRTDREEGLGAGFLRSCGGLPVLPSPPGPPVVVVHGRDDETVERGYALRYAESDPACELHLVAGGHPLEAERHLDLIEWCARDLLRRLTESADA